MLELLQSICVCARFNAPHRHLYGTPTDSATGVCSFGYSANMGLQCGLNFANQQTLTRHMGSHFGTSDCQCVTHMWGPSVRVPIALHTNAGVPQGKCGLRELDVFSKQLSEYYIIVVTGDHIAYHILYENNRNVLDAQGVNAKKLILLYTDGHFDVITSMASFTCRVYYCYICKKGYMNTERHRCTDKCRLCFGDCVEQRGNYLCIKCNIYFKSEACLARHCRPRADGVSVCDSRARCLQCGSIVSRKKLDPKSHDCGQKYCSSCKEQKPSGHLCYIGVAKSQDHVVSEEQGNPHTLINPYLDADKAGDELKYRKFIAFDFETTTVESNHVVVLGIAHRICQMCKWSKRTPDSVCDYCGKHEHVFKTDSEFCEWLFTEENRGAIVFAHNFQSFDGYFILQYLVSQGILPDIVPNGGKIMTMTVTHLDIKFLDTLNFLPMKLAKLPETLGIPELKKGYFPYKFCTRENIDYVGPIPDVEYYNPDGLSSSESITIASAFNVALRTNFLKPKTIGLIPPGGYKPNAKFSKMAINWLKWVSTTNDIRVQHALNGGECFKNPDLISPVRPDRKFGELYQATLEKTSKIRALGYNLVEFWEHEYRDLVKENHAFADFVKKSDILDPLQPRDAFFGGRTNAIKIYRQAEGEEKIKYIDICSLYPYVNSRCSYPIGHPTIVTENFRDIENYYGLIKCKVLPPRGLYLPVLPYRSGGKLTFPLCRTCANESNQREKCHHSDDERSITGTWVTLEVQKAVKLGYKILDIYEIWDWETNETGLFEDYIGKFLKVKTEASGWPAKDMSREQKDKFISDYLEREGIQLEEDKIKKAKGMRTVAKLCLNSMWGKLGQNENKTTAKYISDPGELHRMLLDET
ncbi:uncharacterized protein LOC141904126 [Tubulanus polymorphus]|uniref:uncharacterized protein LOC141904126 n=1 Tax=Tubulanus polymorphus TaxID=672921 RepID=UPI003DA33EE6